MFPVFFDIDGLGYHKCVTGHFYAQVSQRL
jgi:hypothetical protein